MTRPLRLVARRWPGGRPYSYEMGKRGVIVPAPREVVTKNYRYPAPTIGVLQGPTGSKVGRVRIAERPAWTPDVGILPGDPSPGELEFDDAVELSGWSPSPGTVAALAAGAAVVLSILLLRGRH